MAPRRRKRPREVQDRFCEAVRMGATYQHACMWAGIGLATFYEWMRRAEESVNGRRQTKEHADFAEAVRQAEASAVMVLLGQIRTAARAGDWRAAGWVLQNRYHEHFHHHVPAQPGATPGGVTVIFNRPAIDPNVRSHTLDEPTSRMLDVHVDDVD